MNTTTDTKHCAMLDQRLQLATASMNHH